MGQSNLLARAASLVQRWWCKKDPLSRSDLFPSISSQPYSLISQLFCPSLGQTNESPWSPTKEQVQTVFNVHKHTHTVTRAIHYLRFRVRSDWNIQSRVRQSWQSCDICEHCVPVNAITHYPLSLPAQDVQLLSSCAHSRSSFLFVFVISITILLSLCHFQCNILHLKTWILVQFALYCDIWLTSTTTWSFICSFLLMH